ncbi:hypothetical protein [Persicitalea jodogahamensis]|uniref:Uncharacterized protein n=1 Tax=Persicitalea jodogahamensis TaxID=402147 RepID=A0A8J3G8E0_9BACT|nr:hypothetical protein [Persicitalea jodogahamensis]GHB54963.1 hypothetical protein GCM10007390_05110 [Persicitalea jodogahamensis]
MDRKETDHEARETKKIGNVLYWIIGIGIVLSILAFVYSFLRHDGDAVPKSDTPSSQVLSDTVAGDRMSDTLATDMQR